mmetsp:Transcript_35443/g.85511  ORF Transcript_35443/g.85511 Transcript_35443/m.85511 type:complete len:380 (-) Transcript_35443:194-1333(-)
MTNYPLGLTASSTASSALGAYASIRGTTFERHTSTTPIKDAIMGTPVPNKIKVLLKPRFLQHIERISTNREDLALLHVMMIVQRPSALESRNGTLVNHRLSIILTVRLQTIQLEQPIGGRVEFQVGVSHLVHLPLHGPILDGDGCILHQARVPEAALLPQVLEIVPVEGAAQAFAPEHLILFQFLRNTAGGVHVREVQFAARLEEAVAGPQNGLLVGAQVDDAITDDDVHGPVRQGWDVVELLDQSQVELDVVVSELVRVILPRFLRNIQLLLCHVHADHPSLLADKLGCDVYVPSGAASQIQNCHALDLVRDAESASVILLNDVGMDVRDGPGDVRRGRCGGTARVGFEVRRLLEGFAIVGGDGGVRGGFVDEHVCGC